MKRKFWKCLVAFVLALLMGAEPVMSHAMTISDSEPASLETGIYEDEEGSRSDAESTEVSQGEMFNDVLQDMQSSLQKQREQILSDLGMTEEEFETYEPEDSYNTTGRDSGKISDPIPAGLMDIEYTDEETGLSYRELNGTYAEIIGYSGHETEIEIPGRLGVYTIQAIGSEAFKDNTSITSVTMASSITVIGSYAFSGCSSLKRPD